MSDLPEPPTPHYYTLSEEHRRQVRRFQGRDYDADEDSRSLGLWRWGWYKHAPELQAYRDARASTVARQPRRAKKKPAGPVDP